MGKPERIAIRNLPPDLFYMPAKDTVYFLMASHHFGTVQALPIKRKAAGERTRFIFLVMQGNGFLYCLVPPGPARIDEKSNT